jgi:hypothetical protein
LKTVADPIYPPPEPHKRPIGFVHSDEVNQPKTKPESKAIKGVAAKKAARKK